MGRERDAREPRKGRNASGINFFFMHRHMLHTACFMQDLPPWERPPRPMMPLGYGRPDSTRYFDNPDGFSIPPARVAVDDGECNEWLHGLKSAEAYHADLLIQESQYQDPAYLAKSTLGQFGSELELGMRDWLRMRQTSATRDPSNGVPVMTGRFPVDLAPRWLRPENDFLGDPFSPHVSPMFWSFHDRIDDHIEDWYRTHKRFHPDEIQRHEVEDVHQFAPGRQAEVGDPWLGPVAHGCRFSGVQASNDSAELGVGTMKLALRTIFNEEDQLNSWLKRTSRRLQCARSLKLVHG